MNENKILVLRDTNPVTERTLLELLLPTHEEVK